MWGNILSLFLEINRQKYFIQKGLNAGALQLNIPQQTHMLKWCTVSSMILLCLNVFSFLQCSTELCCLSHDSRLLNTDFSVLNKILLLLTGLFYKVPLQNIVSVAHTSTEVCPISHHSSKICPISHRSSKGLPSSHSHCLAPSHCSLPLNMERSLFYYFITL